MSITSSAGSVLEMPRTFTRTLLLCAFLNGCVDRAVGDSEAEYDPTADLRTRAEILRDYCDFYALCRPKDGFSEDFGCEEFWGWRVDLFNSSPEKPPVQCGQLLLDIYACVSLATTCEDFNSSDVHDGPNMRCEHPVTRFYTLKCAP